MKQTYNHYFPTPRYLSMNSCAIDISDQSIKYGELLAKPTGLRLGRFGKEKIPSGVVVSGKIEDEEKLITVLKKIKDRENLSFVRISLPEEQMYIFTLSIPKVNKNKLRDSLFLQIEDHVPLKAEEIIFDFNIISENDQDIFVEVSASAKDVIESYLRILKKAGLEPLSFELEAQAIARAVIPYDDLSPVMIIDFGDTRTGITIVNEGRVFMSTTLSLGGINLTNMIAKNFSLSPEEAEQIKNSYGASNNSNEEDIFPTILNGISVLRDEIEKQYSYWETHQKKDIKNESINRIILCGGGANLTGLSEYLQMSMKAKIEKANVWINILDVNKTIPEISFKESLGYITVLGLALDDYLHKNQFVINVLPEGEKKILKKVYWIRFVSIFLNIISLMSILAILLLFPSFLFSKTKEKLSENKLQIFNNQNPTEQIQNFDSIIKDINSKLTLLDEKKPAYTVNEKILEELLALRPEGVIFSQIAFNSRNSNGSILEVRGKASNRTTLRNLKSALDNNPNYLEVNLPISNFIEKSDLNFIISITLK